MSFGSFPIAVFVGIRQPPPPGFLAWGYRCPGSCKLAASLEPQDGQESRSRPAKTSRVGLGLPSLPLLTPPFSFFPSSLGVSGQFSQWQLAVSCT